MTIIVFFIPRPSFVAFCLYQARAVISMVLQGMIVIGLIKSFSVPKEAYKSYNQ